MPRSPAPPPTVNLFVFLRPPSVQPQPHMARYAAHHSRDGADDQSCGRGLDEEWGSKTFQPQVWFWAHGRCEDG